MSSHCTALAPENFRSGEVQEKDISLFSMSDCPLKNVALLLGATGGGKSTLGNVILGRSVFGEDNGLQSVTTEFEAISGAWFGRGPPITVVDTPGFHDSEGRAPDFFVRLVRLARSFSQQKIRLIIIPIPLTECRATAAFQAMLHEILLLLGDQFLSHTVFVTTQENLLADPSVIASRKLQWKHWLNEHYQSPVQIVHYQHENPESVHELLSAFQENKPFFPVVSEKIDALIASKPHTTVAEAISQVESLNQLRDDHEKRIQALIEERESHNTRIMESENISARMEKRLEENVAEVAELREILANQQAAIHGAGEVQSLGCPQQNSFQQFIQNANGALDLVAKGAAVGTTISTGCSIM